MRYNVAKTTGILDVFVFIWYLSFIQIALNFISNRLSNTNNIIYKLNKTNYSTLKSHQKTNQSKLVLSQKNRIKPFQFRPKENHSLQMLIDLKRISLRFIIHVRQMYGTSIVVHSVSNIVITIWKVVKINTVHMSQKQAIIKCAVNNQKMKDKNKTRDRNKLIACQPWSMRSIPYYEVLGAQLQSEQPFIMMIMSDITH